MKNQYIGQGGCLKEGLGQFANLRDRSSLARKRWVFLREVGTPMHVMKGEITIVCSVFTFGTESSFSYKISYSYSTQFFIVICLNVFLSKHLFEIIILIVFSLLSSLRYFLFTFYLQPN